MKKISSVFFTCIITLVAWVVCGLVLADYGNAGFYYWGGFGFGVLIIVAACVTDLCLRAKNSATVEVNAIPVVYSFVYIVIGLLVNIFFMVKGYGDFKSVLIIANVLMLLAYILVVFYSSKYKNRVSDQIDATVGKTTNTAEIAALAANLLSRATDEDIRKKLYSLKEKIDYSSNVSQRSTAEAEKNMAEKLRNIGEMLSGGSSKEQLLSEINAAEQIWNARNSGITSGR